MTLSELVGAETTAMPSRRKPTGISSAGEVYLKTVLELEEAGIPPIRARIAEHLGHSAPSTNQYIVRLEQSELLKLEGHHRTPRLALTPEGMRRALRAMRQHRLAECYLHRILGLGWSEVHQEACRWERVMSETVTERFDELLGSPRHSPFGNPIPAAEETTPAYLDECQGTLSIVEAAPHGGTPFRAELRWIGEPGQADRSLLHALEQRGVLPGSRLSIEFDWDHAHLVSDAEPEDPLTLDRTSAAQLFVRLL